MTRKTKKILQNIIISLFVIIIIFYGVINETQYSLLRDDTDRLDAEVGAVTDWYRNLREKNFDILEDIVSLKLEDVDLYLKFIQYNRELIKNTRKTVEGFKEVNNTFDLLLKDLNKKFIESSKSKKDFEKVLKNLDKYQKDNAKLIIDNKKYINEKSKKPSYDYLKSVTVVVKGETLDKKWLGTGVIVKVVITDFGIEETYMLTNAHVAGRELEDVELYIENGDALKLAEVVKLHPKLDLALLKVNGKLKDKQQIKGFSEIKPQEPVYLVGHHLGRKYIYGEGVFAGYDRIYDVVQIPTLFGNSGSGVFNKEGKLVSLIFAVSAYSFFGVDGAHGIAVDGLSIKIFLKDLLNK